MVVFISDYPREENERDGMAQRVLAVDSIFSAASRLYLVVSWRRHWRRVAYSRGLVRVECVNLFLHYRYVTQCFTAASCVYIHSVWNAMRALPWIKKFRDKIVADAHGVVPEERVFVGQIASAAVCGAVERVMVRNCRLLIVVTKKMADHFLRKYPAETDASRVMTLPNFDFCNCDTPAAPRREEDSRELRFIYAGGVHKWQNIDLMLATLRRLTDVRRDWLASLYVPPEAVQEVQAKVDRLGCDSQVHVGSLVHGEVLRQYATADVGFVLRESTLLNEVAMPTKLVEYLRYGVVPIVLSPDIGDFRQCGYKYLTVEDLLDSRKLERQTLGEMRRSNFECLASIRRLATSARQSLEAYCKSRQL
jgi:glycosyltransferase involved in cell wall biosynthesis